MAEKKLADSLGVPADRRAAFAEVHANLGKRGASNWEKHLSEARGVSDVDAWLAEGAWSAGIAAELGGELSERDMRRLRDRLVFCGVYGGGGASSTLA